MSGMNGKIKKWKVLTAAVAMAVGFWATPQGAGAATAVSGTGTSVTVGDVSYPITYNSGGATAGTNATAVGDSATASGEKSIAIGYTANASGLESIAIGANATSAAQNMAIGIQANASGWMSMAIGYNASASEQRTTAIGDNANASALDSTAIGYGTRATESAAVAVGNNAEATGSFSIAFGRAKAKEANALALGGSTTIASGASSIAIGVSDTSASGNGSMALGGATVYSDNSIAMGRDSTVGKLNDDGTVVGGIAIGNGIGSGVGATVTGRYGIAIGSESTSSGGIAIGYSASTLGGSIAMGSAASASGAFSFALGNNSSVESEKSIALGYKSSVSGDYSFAAGHRAWSSGKGGIAIGSYIDAGDYSSTATSVSADFGIALGTNASVQDKNGIAIGYGATVWKATVNPTDATNSIAIGYNTLVKADNAVAIGSNSVADTANTISVGSSAVTGGFTRKIVNVSNGTANTDAATYGQLVDAQAVTTTGEGDSATTTTTYTPYEADSDGIVTVKTNNGGTAFTFKVGTSSTDSGLVIGDETNGWVDLSWNGDADDTFVTRGENSTAYGYEANAAGDNSTAIGYEASASGANSTAIGYGSVATKDYSVALGGAKAYDRYSFVVGNGAEGRWVGSIAIGSATSTDGTIAGAKVDTMYGIALGTSSCVEEEGIYGIALGTSSYVNADYSMAFGYGASVTRGETDIYSGHMIAFGYKAGASASNAIALGTEAKAYARESLAFGYGSSVGVKDHPYSGKGGIAIGTQTFDPVEQPESHGAIVTGNYGIAIGSNNTLASASGAVALGTEAQAGGAHSVALGSKSMVTESEGNVISVGSSDATTGFTRKIINVTAGSNATDAANYGQIVTGGSYNSSTGTLTFTNGAGSTAFTIDGISSPDTDTKYTGDNKTVTISTNNVISVNTGGQVSSTDTGIVTGQAVYKAMVTGGSYDSSTGKLTFTNGAGKTAFTIDGFTGGGSGTTYTAGNGIVIDTTGETHTISANVAEKGGLSADANGLAVKVAEKGALSVNESGLSVKVAENGGLTADDNGLAVQKDGQVAKDNTGIVTGGTVYNSMLTNGSYDSSTGKLTFTNGKGDTSFSVAINGSGVIYKGDDKTVTLSDNNEFSVKYDTTDFTVNDSGLAVKKDGKVESGNTGLVTGGTVYDAMKSMDNQVSQLSDDIKKVGAGAAALAALRPEAYDPNDKVSFAVGYGHYKGANAGALGAFFKPNEDTTVSVASTIGNGDPMVNMGVSFKLGNKGKQAGTYRSAVDLVQRIDALEAVVVKEAKRNDIQDSRLNAQERKIAQLQADIARMQQQIANLLSGSGMAIH